MDLATLLENVHNVSQNARAIRSASRESAVAAIRQIEAALTTTLDGEPLRGLKDLGTKDAPFRGARVRALADARLGPIWDPGGHDRGALCLDAHGRLCLVSIRAWVGGADTLHSEPAEDGDLVAEDLQHVIDALLEVLPQHVRASQVAGRRYEAALDLAAKIRQTIGGAS